ncbi:Methionine--tRNA ligase [Nitrospira sp. KM1]|uniref:methionine--tRNA ligase n=1 Tax=Nitrospira sp. KM1 TaxID=1936990 RepID=UPI0013A73105|nr:methionine--tRNA ligase [Nitrospira sp. KM1]BCA54170.1 Methionine--tRNA ligase [Nitrospira sp. KM1]
MTNSQPFYITTPIYYVNDVPHIGHAYTTIAADVLARYWRLRGRDVFFLTGLDEHGQKVQQAAAKAGVAPQTYCDNLAPKFTELWKRLDIRPDAFIRTTDREHGRIVQRYLQELFDTGLIYKDSYTGWYCTFDERFWTEKDVTDGLCPDCKRPVEQLSESNYFFRMGQYQDRLIDHIKIHPRFIRPESRRNEVLGFLQSQKLGDLSISRPKARLSWGIELPFDKDYVTYVWFDALVNYISALEYKPPSPSVDTFWPANVHLVGKDILTTHAVYWSTMLMALHRPLPETIFAHGWWTVNGEKMSKSRGNVVDPNKMLEVYGVDAFRYFLLREVPFGQDGDFSEQAMARRINSDLANGIGNLLSRTLTMIERSCSGTIPDMPRDYLDGEDARRKFPLLVQAKESLKTLGNHLDEMFDGFEFSSFLLLVTSRVSDVDTFIDKYEPWKLAKDPSRREELDTVLYSAAECLRILSLYILPVMPATAHGIAEQLGLHINWDSPFLKESVKWGELKSGTKIRKGNALFPRVLVTESGEYDLASGKAELSKLQGAKPVSDSPIPSRPTVAPSAAASPASAPPTGPPAAPLQITIDEFMKVQLKTARVLSAERVPKSEKLLKLQVSLGSEQRQIVAGIGKKYEPESLIGKTIVIVANLKPAKLMGLESQGMVLAAGDSDVRGLVTFVEEVDPGTKVK